MTDDTGALPKGHDTKNTKCGILGNLKGITRIRDIFKR